MSKTTIRRTNRVTEAKRGKVRVGQAVRPNGSGRCAAPHSSTKFTCQPACEVSVFEETLVRIVRLAAVVLSPPNRPTVRFSHWSFFGFDPLPLHLTFPLAFCGFHLLGRKSSLSSIFFHFVYLSYRTHMQQPFLSPLLSLFVMSGLSNRFLAYTFPHM